MPPTIYYTDPSLFTVLTLLFSFSFFFFLFLFLLTELDLETFRRGKKCVQKYLHIVYLEDFHIGQRALNRTLLNERLTSYQFNGVERIEPTT
jgi:hypothetical protein